MQAEVRARGDEAGDLSALLESLDHGRQIDVGKSVAVVGKKHLLVLEVRSHREKTLPDIAPHAGIDHRHAPVLLGSPRVSMLLPKPDTTQSA